MSTFFSPSRERQLLSRRQGLHSSPMLLPKMPARDGAAGSRRGLGVPAGGAWQGRAGDGGHAVPRAYRAAVLAAGNGRNALPAGPQGQAGGPGEFAPPAGCHGCVFQRSKQREKKKKKENQNVFLGGKKNSRGKKCRRVMRRTGEAKKCMRSSLETGVGGVLRSSGYSNIYCVLLKPRFLAPAVGPSEAS